MKKAISVIVISTTALLQGCATVTRGTTQDFSVTSEPSAAEVRLSTGLSCETPCSLELKRNKGFAGTISKDSFKPVEFTVESGISAGGAAGLAGNLLVGGIIGVGIDAASGATLDLHPNKVHGVLKPEDSEYASTVGIPEPTEKEKADKLTQRSAAREEALNDI